MHCSSPCEILKQSKPLPTHNFCALRSRRRRYQRESGFFVKSLQNSRSGPESHACTLNGFDPTCPPPFCIHFEASIQLNGSSRFSMLSRRAQAPWSDAVTRRPVSQISDLYLNDRRHGPGQSFQRCHPEVYAPGLWRPGQHRPGPWRPLGRVDRGPAGWFYARCRQSR